MALAYFYNGYFSYTHERNCFCRRKRKFTQYVYKGLKRTSERKSPCPVNVTITKGSVHIAVQRGYVDFVLHDAHSQLFLNWVKDTRVPDETFFSSLNASPQLGVPGATKGDWLR